MQQVVARLSGGRRGGVQALRLACRRWRAMCDFNVRGLAPAEMRPRELAVMFPGLQVRGWLLGWHCMRAGDCVRVCERMLVMLASTCCIVDRPIAATYC